MSKKIYNIIGGIYTDNTYEYMAWKMNVRHKFSCPNDIIVKFIDMSIDLSKIFAHIQRHTSVVLRKGMTKSTTNLTWWTINLDKTIVVILVAETVPVELVRTVGWIFQVIGQNLSATWKAFTVKTALIYRFWIRRFWGLCRTRYYYWICYRQIDVLYKTCEWTK